jgi:hypothetical protein
MPHHIHGIRRILREDLTAAAAKTICAAPVVTGCSIVLPHNRPGAIVDSQKGKLTALGLRPAAMPAPLALIGMSTFWHKADVLVALIDVRFPG